jgi:hypothetical protein
MKITTILTRDNISLSEIWTLDPSNMKQKCWPVESVVLLNVKILIRYLFAFPT